MIAIATCVELPEPDVDEHLLLEALAGAGIQAEMAAWDDPSIDWSSYRMCVIRSTWNYPEFPGAFAAWLRHVETQTTLLNDAQTAAWNLDKKYLAELESKGISIVPTVWFEQGSTATSLPWADVVIKPTISAGSWHTRRFQPEEEGQGLRFLNEHLAERGMMVQPYLKSVEQGGEVAWIWIDGELTHGVRKALRLHDGCESVSEAVVPDQEARELVSRIMASVSPGLLYARVDLMESEGRWLLSELELIEPSLFFLQSPAALDGFVKAVGRRIASLP